MSTAAWGCQALPGGPVCGKQQPGKVAGGGFCAGGGERPLLSEPCSYRGASEPLTKIQQILQENPCLFLPWLHHVSAGTWQQRLQWHNPIIKEGTTQAGQHPPCSLSAGELCPWLLLQFLALITMGGRNTALEDTPSQGHLHLHWGKVIGL